MKRYTLLFFAAALSAACGSAPETKAGLEGSRAPEPAPVLASLYGLAKDSAGRVYVQAKDGPIIRLEDADGNKRSYFGSLGSGPGQFGRPYGIAIDSKDRIYVIDQKAARLVRIDDMTGAGWTTFEFQGTPYMSSGLRGLHIDTRDRIYVGDELQGRFLRMDGIEGLVIESFGQTGTGIGRLNAPVGFSTDPEGRVYIADAGNNRVVRINDMDGSGWESYGASGSGEHQFNVPYFVLSCASGRLYVSDSHGRRLVTVEDLQGKGWRSFLFREGVTVSAPLGLLEASPGLVYLVDQQNSRLLVFREGKESEYRVIQF